MFTPSLFCCSLRNSYNSITRFNRRCAITIYTAVPYGIQFSTIFRHNSIKPPSPNIVNTNLNTKVLLSTGVIFFSIPVNSKKMPRLFCLQTLCPARILSLSVENKFHGSLMGYVLVSDIDHPQTTAERISELFLYTFPMWVVFIIIEFYKEKKKNTPLFCPHA